MKKGAPRCSEVPPKLPLIHIMRPLRRQAPSPIRQGGDHLPLKGRTARLRALPTGSLTHTPTRGTVTLSLQTVTVPRVYFELMIEIWRDVHGRLWMDTGRKDRAGEIIIELLDGSQSGAIVDIADRYRGLTPLRRDRKR